MRQLRMFGLLLHDGVVVLLRLWQPWYGVPQVLRLQVSNRILMRPPLRLPERAVLLLFMPHSAGHR
jgi:hypothetical protein